MLLRVPSGYQHWPLQWCNTWPYHALFWLNVLVWALYTACLRRACAFQDLLVCRANTTLIDRCIDQIKIKKSDGLFDPLFCIMQCTCVHVCCYQSFLLCQNSKPTFWPRSPAQARQLDAAGMTYIRAHIQLTRMSFRCLGRLRLSWTNHWPKTNASSLQCEATKSRVDHPAKAPCSLAAVSKLNSIFKIYCCPKHQQPAQVLGHICKTVREQRHLVQLCFSVSELLMWNF